MSRLALALLSLLALANVARADAGLPLRRFGLFVGKNDGGPSRPTLRYAVSDARAVAAVLEQLGGMSADDSLLLEDPDLSSLQNAVTEQIERVRAAEAADLRTELIFYYSGHSDQRGILLGESLIPYEVLKGWLEQVAADVRIVLLDSCSSGTLTRLKGGAHKPPFLFDQSIDVRGHAILTASAEDEAAQESDRIGGSFFTHYLVSGLRGAADSSADGRVTLTEAYRFAFDETLARTGTTKAGAQHPSYDIQLAGTGDLVMTDLHDTPATLTLGPDLGGHIYARDADQRLVAELNKVKGSRTKLGFARGVYTLLWEQGEQRSVARADLSSHTGLELGASAFHGVAVEVGTTRGAERRLVPVGFSLLPPYDTYQSARDGEAKSHLGLHVIYGESAALIGIQLSLGANGVTERGAGAQLGLVANRARNLRGVQLSALGNAGHGEVTGLQLGAIGNLMRGKLRGVQLSAGYAGARELSGLQIASVNVTRGESYGFTIGAFNLAGDLTGAEIGVVNWARKLRGLQASAFNFAANVDGIQLGVVNIASADVHGAQIGLLNYANSTDAGIAPISITREGGIHAQLLSGEIAAFQAALRFDTRYTYSFFGGGIHPFGSEQRDIYLFGGGFGGKAPIVKPLSVEVDAGFYLVHPGAGWSKGANMLAQLRCLSRVELHKQLSFLLGPTLNALIQTDAEERVMPGLVTRRHRATERGTGTQLYYWPGFAAGLRL